jgi:Uma2 family endonuclease
MAKVEQYLRAGVSLVWLIDAELRKVTVYQRGQEMRTLGEQDALTGNGILPGFSCCVTDLFGPRT